MFYFEQLLLTALSGIDSYNITSTVLGVAGTILLLSFLYSAYQAFAMGGDVRMLAIGGITYLILGLVFVNYGTVFRAVISMFNSVADFIYSSVGVGDLFNQWLNDLSNYFNQKRLVEPVGVDRWRHLGVARRAADYCCLHYLPALLHPVHALLRALRNGSLRGGPLCAGLLPARGYGQLARTYLLNLMVFGAWGLIYAILQALDECREHGQSQRRIERQWHS